MFGRTIMFVGAGIFLLGPGDRSAPSTTKYKIETKVETTIDLTAVGQGQQLQNANQVAYLTIALNDTAQGGKVMHVVIDSLSGNIQVPGADEQMAKAKGAWLHGLVTPGGHVNIVKTSADSNDFVAELGSAMRTFFPRTKPGAKQGDSWVDTTAIETKTSNRSVKGTTITTYTVGGEDAMAGASGRRIESTFASTTAGTVENPMAGSMDLEASETGTGKFYVAQDGRYLGGTSQSEGKATVKSAMLPDAIPLKILRTSTISIIK
jgi:hypothetical protein